MAARPFSTQFRRVVVTGMGCVTPLGPTLADTWSALLSPRPSSEDTGITTLERSLLEQDLPEDGLRRELDLAQSLPCQVAAPVRGVRRDLRTARFVQFALLAGMEASQQAGLEEWLGLGDNESDRDDVDETIRRRRERAGVCMGSGMSSVREVSGAALASYGASSVRRLSPHFVPMVLPNSAAGRLGLEMRLGGPNHSASTACAASAHAIGDASRCVQHGDADIMLAGGAEACIDPLSVGGFCRLRALSTGFNGDPPSASRPFDAERDGFVMGEGAAVVVVEELHHALERGAEILCEVSGYGLTGDAFHVTAPDPEGRGAERSIRMALERSGIAPGAVDYVNAHATSTPLGDEIEARAIHRALVMGCNGGGREVDLHVSSTKGATGHLLGAAGGLEAIFAAMSIVDSCIPPTANLVEGECNHDVAFKFVSGEHVSKDVQVAMSNSFGFGGTNASLLFTKYYT